MDVQEMFRDKISGTANLSRTLLSDKDGIVKAIHNANKPAADIVDLSFNIVPGDEVHHYTNGRDRLGQVILRGESLAACEDHRTEKHSVCPDHQRIQIFLQRTFVSSVSCLLQ